MITKILSLFLLLNVFSLEMRSSTFEYPKTRKSDQADDYHGTKVADPYRWLEDPDSPESRQWIEAENKITFDFLKKIPARQKIKERLTELWNYERFGVPSKEGSRYFFTRNDGLQNQNVLYTMEQLDAAPHLVLDPNKLSTDGTVALKGVAISEDGEYMAYGLSSAGSDWEEWRVRKVATAEDTDDVLKWVKFSGASWTHDGSWLFLQPLRRAERIREAEVGELFPEALFPQTWHAAVGGHSGVSSSRSEDWGIGAHVTEDGRYLIISLSDGTDVKNRVYYKELPQPTVASELAYEHGRQWFNCSTILMRFIQFHRKRGSGLLVPQRLESAARKSDRYRHPETRAR